MTVKNNKCNIPHYFKIVTQELITNTIHHSIIMFILT